MPVWLSRIFEPQIISFICLLLILEYTIILHLFATIVREKFILQNNTLQYFVICARNVILRAEKVRVPNLLAIKFMHIK